MRDGLAVCLIAASALQFGCGRTDEEHATDNGAQVSLPASIAIASPAGPIRDMELVESYSEEVANRLIGLADKLRRRDFSAATEWISEDFAGTALAGLELAERTELPLETRRDAYDAALAEIVDRAGFLASIARAIGAWKRVESVVWKVKAAEFEPERPLWGRVRLKLTFLGEGEAGDPRALVAWAYARVARRAGRWMLERLQLESYALESRERTLFTDVSTAVGLAHSGVRFGTPGNDSFAWNGAAAGDVDGDGAWDIFVPSRPHNFLYVARSGGWVDEAEMRGVAGAGGVPAGGTGAVFFDFDGDRDQDLAVAGVGWGDDAGTSGGDRLRLYVNDGEGRFTERGQDFGFDARIAAYSVVVLDYDDDGWPDVFVCNYGRVEAEPNNSWTDATNGAPNALFRNVEGKRFVEVAAAVGLSDRRWSYAAAAADVDEDGDLDLYVANDYGPNSLWINTEGKFRDRAAEAGVLDLGNGMGCAFGDLDSDGRLDLYVANMSSTAGNRILARLGNREGSWQSLRKMAAGNTVFYARGSDAPDDPLKFVAAPSEAGGIGASWAWAPAIFDLDLDGLLDVYCCNGFVTGDTLADT